MNLWQERSMELVARGQELGWPGQLAAMQQELEKRVLLAKEPELGWLGQLVAKG